jgi:Flp pilus assembly protein protease CpaA
VKLFAAAGALLGPATTVRAFFFTAIAGGVLALIVALRRRRFAQTIGATARLVADRTSAVAAIESPAADNRFAYAPAIAIGVVMAALSW